MIRLVGNANVLSDEFEYDDSDPDGYRAGMARVGKAAGGDELAVKAFLLPPGQSLCPYHYEYVEEWLLVVEGTVVVRDPEREVELVRGTLTRFGAGPSGAHQVSNRGTTKARVLLFSKVALPSVSVYPDSDTIGVWPDDDTEFYFKRSGAVSREDVV